MKAENLRDNSEKVITAKRRLLVLQLRRKGLSYSEVAQEVVRQIPGDELPKNWGEKYAAKDVSRLLKNLREEIDEEIQTVRQLELDRLDALLEAIWEDALEGQVTKIDRVLAIMARRAKYIPGVEAPKEIVNEFRGKLGRNSEGLDRSISTLASTLNTVLLGKIGEGGGALESGEREAVASTPESSG